MTEAIRLGASQKYIAKRLTAAPEPPLEWGTASEVLRIYDRLIEMGIAEGVDNPALGTRQHGQDVQHPTLYKRGKRWNEAAARYGWEGRALAFAK